MVSEAGGPRRTYVPDVRQAVEQALGWLGRHRRWPADPVSRVRLLWEIQREAHLRMVSAVEEAIASGVTWAVIAENLEVSPQAAHQRYAPTLRLRAERRRREGQTPGSG